MVSFEEKKMGPRNRRLLAQFVFGVDRQKKFVAVCDSVIGLHHSDAPGFKGPKGARYRYYRIGWIKVGVMDQFT